MADSRVFTLNPALGSGLRFKNEGLSGAQLGTGLFL